MSDTISGRDSWFTSVKVSSVLGRLWKCLSAFYRQELLTDPIRSLTPQISAQLLFKYCLASDKKVGESVHRFFIMAEHYSSSMNELKHHEDIAGLPAFFSTLTPAKKAEFCYNQVIEALSLEAMPVTAESLRATKRADLDNPWSSYAGQFVRYVTKWVLHCLIAMVAAYFVLDPYFNFFERNPDFPDRITEGMAMQWVAFGCLGALIHLLNHALTATRLQTFEVSEARKVGPRLLLGGMFGFVVPWMLSLVGLSGETIDVTGSVAAFFGGYSVRFSIGLLERLMAALMPETSPKR